MKPLSTQLAEVEPQQYNCYDETGRHVLTTADYNDYQKLKAVAILLAEACELINKRAVEHSKCNPTVLAWTNVALAKAADLLGEK